MTVGYRKDRPPGRHSTNCLSGSGSAPVWPSIESEGPWSDAAGGTDARLIQVLPSRSSAFPARSRAGVLVALAHGFEAGP